MQSADYWIEKLGLQAHPEGGYFRELYRSDLTQTFEMGQRNLATSIYFLLCQEEKSHFHQLTSDELWYFHAGGPASVHIFDHSGYRNVHLGLDLEAGQLPQILLPRKCIFAAEVLDKSNYTLTGCVVAPGFDFQDFRLVPKRELLADFPEYAALIERFCLC